jgi:hypothetical protein
MELLDEPQPYRTEGYSDQQVHLALTEMKKGTKVSKIKDKLFYKFALTEKENNVLIKSIAKEYDFNNEDYLNLSDEGFKDDTSSAFFYLKIIILGALFIGLATRNFTVIPLGLLLLLFRFIDTSKK